MKMVPQQVSDVRSLSPSGSSNGLPVFGSQLVDKNSSTPYTDATQVSKKLQIPTHHKNVKIKPTKKVKKKKLYKKLIKIYEK